MKKILEFNIPEDQEEFEIYNKAVDMSIALHEIGEEVFRPARKHGYEYLNPKIQKLIDQNPEYATELIWKLEELYRNILNNRGLHGI